MAAASDRSSAELSQLSSLPAPAHPGLRALQEGDGDDPLDRLADQIADRVAVRLGGLMPAPAEPLVDAAEIARIYGKTRSWVYEHAGELGAVRLGKGSRPRLGFSPARVASQLEKVTEPMPLTPPQLAKPQRGRRSRPNRTLSGAELLRVRSDNIH